MNDGNSKEQSRIEKRMSSLIAKLSGWCENERQRQRYEVRGEK